MMCGISGIFSKHIKEEHKKLMELIVENQWQRGPDHQEICFIKTEMTEILLGHNRLSIIDLSKDANQPMWDSTKRYCIVYNGEIYNYIELRDILISKGVFFQTLSDTEVILNAFAVWGIAALNEFRGPFAFALFDSQKQELWLCRDRFGIRPLYYTMADETLYFASSINTLAKHLNLKPNLDYIAQGLNYLVYEDGSENTPYHNLLSLPAGHYFNTTIMSKGVLKNKIQKYYDLVSNVPNRIEELNVKSYPDLLALIAFELEQSVKIRLRSDVPIAISLSSGLDSSSIASLVSEQHENLLGFTFSHPHMRNTEGPLVAECAKFLNINIEYVWPTLDELVEGLFKTIEAQQAPFSSFSVVAQYLLYQRVRSLGIKVLLGGQGGDEVFMGYRKFFLFWIQQLLRKKRYIPAIQQMIQMIPLFWFELKSLPVYWQHRHRYFKKSHDSSDRLTLLSSPILNLNPSNQALWKRQSQDILQFSLPSLLRYEDRNAMGNSVESRLPYMDHHLVELGLALPESLKLRRGFGKWAIRKIMQNKIPNRIRLARYKRGFDVPIKDLVKKGLGSIVREKLKKNQGVIQDFLSLRMNIDKQYSDQSIQQRHSAMSEIITLLWLDKVIV